jgi:hypothetical protein
VGAVGVGRRHTDDGHLHVGARAGAVDLGQGLQQQISQLDRRGALLGAAPAHVVVVGREESPLAQGPALGVADGGGGLQLAGGHALDDDTWSETISDDELHVAAAVVVDLGEEHRRGAQAHVAHQPRHRPPVGVTAGQGHHHRLGLVALDGHRQQHADDGLAQRFVAPHGPLHGSEAGGEAPGGAGVALSELERLGGSVHRRVDARGEAPGSGPHWGAGLHHRRLGQRPDRGGGRGRRPFGVTGHGPCPLAQVSQLGTGAATGPGAGTRGTTRSARPAHR